MKGYIILFKCGKGIIRLPSRKEFLIEEGYYAYVGSCGLNCSKRVSRHMTKDKKKLHWHVDYLLSLCESLFAISLCVSEEEIAKKLSRLKYVKGFGSTDDRENLSHLFIVEDIREFISLLTST